MILIDADDPRYEFHINYDKYGERFECKVVAPTLEDNVFVIKQEDELKLSRFLETKEE